MLSELTQDVISRSLLKEKITEERYGTVNEPKFIDSHNALKPAVESVMLSHLRKKHHGATQNGSNATEMSRSGTEEPPDLQREPDIGRFKFSLNGKDVYQNALTDNGHLMGDKAALFAPTNGTDTYFRCANCQREIAGSRFAAHIDKCFAGRSRKREN